MKMLLSMNKAQLGHAFGQSNNPEKKADTSEINLFSPKK